MDFSLVVHLAVHFFSGVLAGYLAYLVFRKSLFAMLFGLFGGFLIDLDHFFDFFLTFGFTRGLGYFFNSYQFSESGKLYILFHAYEYILLGVLILFFIKNIKIKTAFLALSLGMFFHLAFDLVINEMPTKAYSILYRSAYSFELGEILEYGENYNEYLQDREMVGFPE